MDHLLTIVEGDAHKNILKLTYPVDLVFIDADKPGYVDCVVNLLPLVQRGDLILAHNIDMAPRAIRFRNGVLHTTEPVSRDAKEALNNPWP